MKLKMKKVLSLLLVAVMAAVFLETFSMDVNAKTKSAVKAVQAERICLSGKYVYYTDIYAGDIHRINTKTGKNEVVCKKEGYIGYNKILVKGKYIYAEIDCSEPSDGIIGSDLYRISIDGKKKTRIISGFWGEFMIAGSRIYYNEVRGYSEGDFVSVKLDGTDKKAASKSDVVLSSNSPAAIRRTNSGVQQMKTGKYTFNLSSDKKTINRGKKAIFKVSETDSSVFISGMAAHKGVLLVEYKYSKNGVPYGKLVYMDKNGKKQQVVEEYPIAGSAGF